MYRIKKICSSARFDLSELEDDMYSRLLIVKKEKVPPSLPPNKTQFDSTVKTSTSCKRKPYDASDLENIAIEEPLKN